MLANSWLYHYYSVQSKIQFGLPYEGPGANRVPPPATSYYHHHHHSPTLQASLTHPYVSSGHHMPYGYHSPVGIGSHQGSPGLIGHHNGGHHGIGAGGGGENYRPYAYRIDPLQPVDYSSPELLQQQQQQQPQPQLLHLHDQPAIIQIPELRCSSANSTTSGSQRIGTPPPSKRRAIARLEPLYIPENSEPLDTAMVELSSQHSQNSDGGTALLTTVIPSSRHRFHTKAMPPDPADFMDQWNPSPPWSETAQKVPDMMQQELSPYLTTTPPTPTSAPPASSSHGPAFSFDWMPEQFVPIMDCTTTSCVPCLSIHDGGGMSAGALQMPVSMQLQMTHWPTDHRLQLCTQSLDMRHSTSSSGDDEAIGGK